MQKLVTTNNEVSQEGKGPDLDPVRLALQRFGDSWSFQILRAAFYGVRRFDGFQAAIGASPSLLTGRLKRLTEDGLFERIQYGDHAKRFEYILTEKGKDLYPVIVLVRQWGLKWVEDAEVKDTLIHSTCGEKLTAIAICEACSEPLSADDVIFKR